MACYAKFSNMFDVTHILHTDCRRCVDNKKSLRIADMTLKSKVLSNIPYLSIWFIIQTPLQFIDRGCSGLAHWLYMVYR